MAGKPLFWRVFDKAEQTVAPRLEEAVRSSAFLGALSLAARAQARVRRDVERRSRRLWHLVNLPAGSDVTHLRRQVAELDRELRRMEIALERALADRRRGEEDHGDRPAQPGRRARPRPARRGAQRAAGS
jgi:hypothetical protein